MKAKSFVARYIYMQSASSDIREKENWKVDCGEWYQEGYIG